MKRRRVKTAMRMKTYKKSAAFWKHGKHRSILGELLEKEKEGLKNTPKPAMYASVSETFRRERR